jgi:acyl-homoserine-lactone acylase
MKKLVLVLVTVACVACAPHASTENAAANGDVAAWAKQAQNVTIIRDDWGIAHVYGKTDADAVFGVIYAQAEDDFNRVETNYLNSMGRLAEAEGEAEIYRDLRMKLFIDPADIKAQYEKSPDWLKALMNSWAGGLNYYLHKHPDVKPRVIAKFEPWMALTFSEGSIGGDIERVNLKELEAFYGNGPKQMTMAEPPLAPPAEPTGSNGIAVAPSNTSSKHALLLINPHTSFFFRSEAQMVSEEGLNAYGALTWGQFFIYQGFNDRAGWMHTSSGVDNIDEYLETVVKKGDGFAYKYGSEERPVTSSKIVVPYKSGTTTAQKEFIVYRTHHGPIVREADGKWVSVRLMQEPLKALTQSYSRTKAKDYKAFRDTMDLHTNSSNNTIYADADGTIAYFHSNFIPKRDTRFDWTKPVAGSDPATEWNGVLSIDETPGLRNPGSGWLYNTNNWPWSAAGPDSPKKSDFPAYVERGDENPRGVHAIRVLEKKKDFTLESLLAAAYDSYQPEFAILIPGLLKAYDQTPASNPLKAKLAEQIKVLRDWDYRWSVSSVPNSLAIFWGDDLWQRVTADARKAGVSVYQYMETKATPQQKLESLAAASDKLQADFGTWKTPWGDINRFQRLNADIVHPFDDKGSKKIYGTSGNSFVAVVEFGDQVRAKAITAGGESGDPKSKHFNDQAQRYATGDLRDVYFYRQQLEGHTQRTYKPGE